MALYQKGSHLKSCDVAVTLFKHFLGLWLVTLFLYTVTTYVVFGSTAKLFEGDAFFRLFFFVFVFVPHEADLNGGFFYLFSIFVQLVLFYPFLQKLTLRGNGIWNHHGVVYVVPSQNEMFWSGTFAFFNESIS